MGKLVQTNGRAQERGEPRMVGVIKLPVFAKNTPTQVKGAVVGLIKEGAQALIIDLRGNVGGYFPAGVDLAKELLPSESMIVSVNDRNGAGTEYRTDAIGSVLEIPGVLLKYLLLHSKKMAAPRLLESRLTARGWSRLSL